MKKIVHINSVKNGSTGRIMNSLAREGRKEGMQVYTSCAGNLYQRKLPTECPQFHIYIGGIFENKLHKTLGTMLGYGGCFSQIGTYFFLKRLDRIQPDLIHLHNLHSNYINLKMLFRYVKKRKIPLVWTLHDCWAFTGHCPHFDIVGCNRWKEGCYVCPQYREYPEARVDDAKWMYRLKKKYFTGLSRVEIVTPSVWLANLVRQSFLRKYPVSVIRNGIDLNTFQYTPSDFRKEHKLEKKIVILGVAFSWGYKKGLDVFCQLSEKLSDKYQIVLVGVGKKEKEELPQNIISIGLTDSVEGLAQIYSAADIFVNPTREDNFPTTHLEALGCGIPVITFDTGGAPESIDELSGRVVEKENVEGLLLAIEQLIEEKVARESCRNRALLFDEKKKIEEYLELYKRVEKEL